MRQAKMRPMFRYTLRILAALAFASLPDICGAQPSVGADTAIRPFTIRVPDAVLADLKARLKSPRVPDGLNGDGWTYGTDTAYLKQLDNNELVPNGPGNLDPGKLTWSELHVAEIWREFGAKNATVNGITSKFRTNAERLPELKKWLQGRIAELGGAEK